MPGWQTQHGSDCEPKILPQGDLFRDTQLLVGLFILGGASAAFSVPGNLVDRALRGFDPRGMVRRRAGFGVADKSLSTCCRDLGPRCTAFPDVPSRTLTEPVGPSRRSVHQSLANLPAQARTAILQKAHFSPWTLQIGYGSQKSNDF
jgi:hypothetical protein